MTARVRLPAELGDSFSVARATELGVGARRLWGSDLVRPFWGVRAAAGSLSDTASLARAYATRMPPLAFFSHATAAQLWDIPLPLSLHTALPLHVSVPRPRRAPEGSSIAGHRLSIDRVDVAASLGLALSSPERTVVDLAAALDDEQLLAALDNILWRRRPATSRATRSSIAACCERYAGRRGRTRVESLLALSTDRSDSSPESAFRLRFIRARLPDPVPNQTIYGADGKFIAMPDLQFLQYRMAFDYEGDHHRTDARQWRKDLRRVPLLEDVGWHHTRISADDLADSTDLLRRTVRRLAERGWTR